MQRLILFISLFLLVMNLPYLPAEEGMYPISNIPQQALKAAGLQISPAEIYHPSQTSVIDAIVKLGGCTGSFVSENGLILTNHHCAYYAAQTASSAENDYIRNGFIARNQDEEIPTRVFTVRITQAYEDVSPRILTQVTESMSPIERTQAIERTTKQIIAETEKKYPGKRAEVSEMFAGKKYVLFIYEYLKDVRLVYFPPAAIGEFGGNIDNWEWPRHTGDFAFMRVYVAPDGASAEYSPDNIPYRPQRHLKIAPQGVEAGDFVFICGYPGRTYRHRTSHYLAYEQDVRLPYIAQLYRWQIDVMEQMSANSREIAIKHLSRIKSRSNTLKNYQGKLQGIRRLDLVQKKQQKELALQQFIESEPERQQKYGSLLSEIAEVYAEQRANTGREFILEYLTRNVDLLYLAHTIYRASVERQKPDLERESAYMERNFPETQKRIFRRLKNYYQPSDRIFLKELLQRVTQLPKNQRITVLDEILSKYQSIDEYLNHLYQQTQIADVTVLQELLQKPPEQLRELADPAIRLMIGLEPVYAARKKRQEERSGKLNRLYGLLIEVKSQFLQDEFIPDANRTLRLTYGHIRGYSPADAVFYQPITTIKGIIEKHTGQAPFNAPQVLIERYHARDFQPFAHPGLKSVPVGILYDTDTTGGNSGSPVLNVRGELVGLNFDRAYSATINDYAWNKDYSRSIGVDIRYILWVTQKLGRLDGLLAEMGIRNE